MTARLIVTADDVGLHPGMTEGALRAHRDGIVTACSVAANGRHVEEAAVRLLAVPDLAVGIHFTLVGEAPVSPPGRVRSLLGPDGRLLDDWPALVKRYLLGRVDLDEVETELRAQTTLLAKLGLRPVHANGHQHLHVLPGVFPRVLAIAAEAGIRYLRVPRDRSRLAWSRLRRHHPPPPGERLAWARLRRHHPPPPGERLAWSVRRLGLAGLEACGALALRSAAQALRRAEGNGERFIFPNMTPGIAVAGRLDTASLLALLSGIQGLAELVVHPGVGGEEISKDYAWAYNWDAETAALCAPAVRAEIASRGIVLTSMGEC